MSLSVRLKKDQMERLDRLAKETGRTKTYYVSKAIDQCLEDFEDLYMAEKISADIRSGKEKTYSFEEVMKENGLSD